MSIVNFWFYELKRTWIRGWCLSSLCCFSRKVLFEAVWLGFIWFYKVYLIARRLFSRAVRISECCVVHSCFHISINYLLNLALSINNLRIHTLVLVWFLMLCIWFVFLTDLLKLIFLWGQSPIRIHISLLHWKNIRGSLRFQLIICSKA